MKWWHLVRQVLSHGHPPEVSLGSVRPEISDPVKARAIRQRDAMRQRLLELERELMVERETKSHE